MRFLLLITFFLVALGCDDTKTSQNARPLVVTTTTMLASMVQAVGGDLVEVRSLVYPGGDPHSYQPTPRDVRDVARASLIVTNGLGLEGWMTDLVRNAGKGASAKIVIASEGIEPLKTSGAIDPHFWFDVLLWKQATHTVEARLVALLPEGKETIHTQAEDYRRELDGLNQWIIAQIQKLPAKSRVLVTSHDAFHYLGRAYKLRVVGIQGVSTEHEASQRDIINVIEIVRESGVKAIFGETSVNPALVNQVARETGVDVRGPLYSDSLGGKGSGAENYQDMVIQNITAITEGLGGEVEEFPKN